MTVWLVSALIALSVEITGLDGAVIKPLEPHGTANVLLFVAADCPVSNAYAPEIQRICASYAAKGATCLLFYEGGRLTAAATRRHLTEYGYGSRTAAALDRDGQLADRVGVDVTPAAVVIDRQGATRYHGRIDNRYVDLGRQRRVVTEHDLIDALDAVVAGRAVARSQTTPVGCFIAPSSSKGPIE